MATTTKLTIYVEDINSTIEVEPFKGNHPGDVLFSIKEYHSALLTVKDSEKVEVMTNHSGMVTVIGGSTLINNYNNGNYLIPGTYPIIVDGQTFYFRVIPQNQTQEVYEDMLKQIEDKFQSMMFSSDTGRHSLSLRDLKDINQFVLYCKQLQSIVGRIKRINPTGNISLQKRRIIEDRSVNPRGRKIVEPTLNNAENQMLLKDSKLLIRDIDKRFAVLDSIDQKIQVSIVAKNFEVEDKIDKCTRASRNCSPEWLSHTQKRINLLQDELSELEEELAKLERVRVYLSSCRKALKDLVLNLNPTVKDVNHPISRSPLYLSIHNDAAELYASKPSRKLMFKVKNSETLFEYYGLLVIFKSLEELGFKASCSYSEILDKLSTSSCAFIGNNMEVEVIYDKDATDISYEQAKGIFSVNSKHTRPDIVLNLFKQGKYVKSLVIEAKYRNALYLYNDAFQTPTEKTILDYKQLAYSDDNHNLLFNTVSKVILLYPKQANKVSPTKQLINKVCSFYPIAVGGEDISYMVDELKAFVAI